ncbi:MAG: TetR/AcrR family transcriptional regulator [Sedimentibacter sp.]|uniref:TetR/AcrR family transcriptional regulator n=1 Tax=Sedimentibacter sp. TaxID=1960295 RepID=UPI003159625F
MKAILTKSQKTKKILFDCALELFREKGYDNVSVSEIVKKAQTAKGTFYIYFDSKAKIITELFEKYDDYYDEVYENMDKTLPAKDRLMIIIKESLSFTSEKIGYDLINVLYQSQLSLVTKATNAERSLYRIVTELVEEGQKNGQFTNELSSNEITKMIVRNIRGTFYDWCLQRGGFDIVADGCEYMKTFLNGITIG